MNRKELLRLCAPLALRKEADDYFSELKGYDGTHGGVGKGIISAEKGVDSVLKDLGNLMPPKASSGKSSKVKERLKKLRPKASK